MVKHSYRRLPNERAADFIYIGAVRIVTATIIRWLCNTATAAKPIFCSWYRPKFLCLTLCVTFSTHISTSLCSMPSNLCRTSNLKQLLLRAHLHPKIQPSPQLYFRHLHPQPPSLLKCPQSHEIFQISIFLFLLKMQPWSPWRTIMDTILVTTCQNLRMMS